MRASPGNTGLRSFRSELLAVSLTVGLCITASCVDTTPPWEKVRAQGGAGGIAGAAGAGGAVDSGAGGRIDVGPAWDGSAGEAGGAIDAPTTGAGGAVDAGLGGAGGLDSGGSIIDVAMTGTGGAGGSVDGGFDVPLGGAGGGSGAGGGLGTGGTTRTGGRTGTGGARTGGRTGTGGARTGGAPGSGGTVSPDVGPDLRPDLGPDLGPDTPDANPLLVGLVAYYKCDETSGGTLADSSGNGYGGTLNGTASFGAGRVGNALVLTASGSGYASLPTAVFSSLGDFTIATWVNVTSSTYEDWMRIFDTGINANQTTAPRTGTQYMNLTPRNNDGNMRWTITKNGIASEESLNTSSLPATAWKHVTVVLTGGLGTLYVDGVEAVDDTTEMKPSDITGMDYAYLGKSQFGVDAYFDGMLDEFRVYNRALSTTEVQALYSFTGP